MKLTSLTSVIRALWLGRTRSSVRAAYSPPKPPPAMTTFQAMRDRLTPGQRGVCLPAVEGDRRDGQAVEGREDRLDEDHRHDVSDGVVDQVLEQLLDHARQDDQDDVDDDDAQERAPYGRDAAAHGLLHAGPVDLRERGRQRQVD